MMKPKNRTRRRIAPPTPPAKAAIRSPPFWLLPLVPFPLLLLPLSLLAVVVVMLLLLLLPVGSFELKEYVPWPGQLVSVPPVMLVDPSVVLSTVYDWMTLDAPWLFVGKSVAIPCYEVYSTDLSLTATENLVDGGNGLTK